MSRQKNPDPKYYNRLQIQFRLSEAEMALLKAAYDASPDKEGKSIMIFAREKLVGVLNG